MATALPPPLAFLTVFYFYPLLSILGLSFAPEGRLQLGGLAELVARPYFARVLWFTFWQAVASTVLTLLLGLPAAYVFARYDFPAKSALRALTTIPFVMPTVVVGAAFVTLFGPRGVLNEWLVSTFAWPSRRSTCSTPSGSSCWLMLSTMPPW